MLRFRRYIRCVCRSEYINRRCSLLHCNQTRGHRRSSACVTMTSSLRAGRARQPTSDVHLPPNHRLGIRACRTGAALRPHSTYRNVLPIHTRLPATAFRPVGGVDMVGLISRILPVFILVLPTLTPRHTPLTRCERASAFIRRAVPSGSRRSRRSRHGSTFRIPLFAATASPVAATFHAIYAVIKPIDC